MKKIISLIFGLLTIGISIISVFTNLPFIKENMDSIILFIFGTIIMLIWKNNEDELKRDENEKNRQNKTFEILNRLTRVIIEIFKGTEYPKKYYEFRISTANDKVKDLTWAFFDKEDKLDGNSNEYLNKIQKVAESGINYDEIFIFHRGELNRKDRIEKLKFHYLNAISSKRKKSKYSCSYIDVRNNLDFPRIQFTIIDNEEIIFTSGFRTKNKFTVKNRELVDLFENYYNDAWEISTKLILNGEVVKENEDIIKQIINGVDEK